MPNDDTDFGLEETKSTILDYLLLFKEVKWVVISTIVASIAIILLIFGVFSLLVSEIDSINPNQLGLFLVGLITIFTISLMLPFFNGKLFLQIISKGKKQQRELLAIQSGLMRKSYLMNFELVEPEVVIKEGDPRLEKIMNHLSFVFPEIDRINKKRIKQKKSVEKYAKKFKRRMHFLRNYDLGIKTATGWYIIQFFDKPLKFDDIEEIGKRFLFDKLVGAEIQRIIIVGKEFDSSFDKEKIEEKMSLLKRRMHIDIILEDEYGYSTVWID